MNVSTTLISPGDPTIVGFGPTPVVLGRVAPGDGLEVFRAYCGQSLTGQLLPRCLKRLREFQELGVPVPKTSGIGIFDWAAATAMCDSRGETQRFHRLQKALPRFDDTVAKEFVDLIRAIPELPDDTDAESEDGGEKDDEIVIEFARRADHLASRIPGFGCVVNTKTAAKQVVEQLNIFTPLTANLEAETQTALAVRTDGALSTRNQSISEQAQRFLDGAKPFVQSYAAINLYDLNAGVAVPEVVYVVNCPEGVEYALAHDYERLTELLLDLDEPAIDLMLAEPLSSLDSLSGITAAMGATPKLLGGIWAGFDGYADADHLREIATDNGPQGTISAGKVWLFAGRGRHKVVEGVSVAPAVAGLRSVLDLRLEIPAQMYGPLIPLFGAQAEKEMFGFDELDTADWNMSLANDLGMKGFNVVRKNRKGFVSVETARTRSSLPAHSKIDPVRVHALCQGSVQRYMENEARGDLNVDAVRRHHCERATEMVPLHGVPGFLLVVGPAPGEKPGLFNIRTSTRLPDSIETFKFVSSIAIAN